jgi:hypothetical protein
MREYKRTCVSVIRFPALQGDKSDKSIPRTATNPGLNQFYFMRQSLNSHHSAAHSHRSATSGSTFVARRAGT